MLHQLEQVGIRIFVLTIQDPIGCDRDGKYRLEPNNRLLENRAGLDASGAEKMQHAIDDDAAAFYRKYGFEPSPADPKQLMLLMKDLRATLNSLQ